MENLLEVKNLRVSFSNEKGSAFEAVKGIDFNVQKGAITAIVGESGSGKSVTAFSLMQLLPKSAQINGVAAFNSTNLISLSAKEMNQLRGNAISMIFQEPMTSLNPVYTCGNQVMEALLHHKKISKSDAKAEVLKLFEQVKLPDPETAFNKYPHQLSGGQKQRVMIAMAISCQPQLLIADEPTTALDVRVQKSIMQLLKKLQIENNISILLITHDLALVSEFADEIVVMYKGEIVEKGTAQNVLYSPQHQYTKALLACKPSAEGKGRRLKVLEDFLSGKEKETVESNSVEKKNVSDQRVLEVKNLVVKFPSNKNIFGRVSNYFTAVDNVSFDVFKNETIGLVGESGCGKTTLGRAILRLIQPNAGEIILNGNNLATQSFEQLRVSRRDMQIVFQDPYGSMNPRITIGDAIAEPLAVHGLYKNAAQRRDKAAEMLEQVGLQAGFLQRYPHQFSGGQRQRICIARSLALDPSFIVFDESVSALDVSVQAQVLNLINDLKAKFQFTSIFISHDLGVVHYISDRILVMHQGKIVEQGSAAEIFFKPKENYTKSLLDAMPKWKQF